MKTEKERLKEEYNKLESDLWDAEDFLKKSKIKLKEIESDIRLGTTDVARVKDMRNDCAKKLMALGVTDSDVYIIK